MNIFLELNKKLLQKDIFTNSKQKRLKDWNETISTDNFGYHTTLPYIIFSNKSILHSIHQELPKKDYI